MAKSVLSPQEAPDLKKKGTTGRRKVGKDEWCLPGYEHTLDLTADPNAKVYHGQEGLRQFLVDEGFKVD